MRSYGPQKRTLADKRTALTLLLYRCTPIALANFTVDQLVAFHGVPRKEAEYELQIARQKRAGELA